MSFMQTVIRTSPNPRRIFSSPINSKIVPSDVEWEDTIPFVVPVSEAKVIKCYDGDTITIAFKLSKKKNVIYRLPVRLRGIDCPELRTKDPNEKECAELAKQMITDLVLGKIVKLQNRDMDKYGRLLADVIVGNTNISEVLILNRLAIAYDGGTKQVPSNWMNYYKFGEF